MKNILKYLLICIVGYLVLYTGFSVFAANIDSTNKWAWGTNIGWVNFNPTLGNVTVTDTEVTGKAWSNNYGWIEMQPTFGGVTNTVSGLNGVGTCIGTLSGDAWNTNLGWINFDGVSIDENGFFSGTATGTGSGPISMSGSNHVVQTTWTPDCVPPAIPTCTTSPSPANAGTVITTTCTGVEIGATVTIPNMSCSDTPATSTTVVCQGTVGTGSGQVSVPDDTVTVTDPTGNTNTDETTGLVIDNTPPLAPVITSPSQGDDLNDSTPTVTGTGTPGDTITVTGPLGETCTAVVDASGDWSCDIAPALAEGPNVISATATDPAGNTTPATPITVDIDTIAPTTPTIANPVEGIITNDNTPVINGTGEPGTIFTLTNGSGALVGTGVVDTNGDWTFTPTTPLPDGNNTITVITTDDAGNVSPSDTVNFTIDTLAPPPPVINTPIDGSTITDNTPVINGTGEPGTIFTLTNGSGALVGTGVVDTNGDWTFTPTASFPDGPNTLNVVLTDDAGNQSSPVSSDFIVDTTPPATPTDPDLQSGSDTGDSDTDDTTSDTTPTFDVACTEIGSTLTLYSSGSTIGTHTCTSVGPATITPAPALADGVYNVAYTETDPVGNESPLSPDLTVTVDSTAPTAPLIENPATGLVTNDNTPIINGTAEPNSTIELTNASGAVIGTTTTDSNGDWTFTPTVPFDDGGQVVNATATDAAGNESPVATTTFIVDTLAPTPLVLNTPIDGSIINDNTPDITGTGEPGTTFTLTDENDALIGTGTVDTNGDWSFTPTTPLPEGENTVNVTLTDLAGNEAGPESSTFTVDTIAPTTPASAPDLQPGSDTGDSDTDDTTADTTPSFDVVCTEVGSVITLYTDNPTAGTVAGTHTCTAIGSEQVTASPELPEGVHNITYTQTDVAGNESVPSPSLPVTVDTTAPTTPASAPDLQSGSDTGVSSTDDTTNDTSPTLDVVCSAPGNIITLFDGSTPIGTHTCTGTGTESITPTSPLFDGVYDINYTETDLAGNTSLPSPSLPVTIDATIPVAPIVTSPTEGIELNDATPTVTGTGIPGDTITVTGPLGETCTVVVDGSGNWACDISPALVEGPNTLDVIATDPAGNISPTTSVSFILDVTPPVITITNSLSPNITGTGEPGDTVSIITQNGSTCTTTVNTDGTWVCSLSPTPSPLGETFTATETDPAGNTAIATGATIGGGGGSVGGSTGGGGGGGSSRSRDNCPDGDLSGNLYDNTCESPEDTEISEPETIEEEETILEEIVVEIPSEEVETPVIDSEIETKKTRVVNGVEVEYTLRNTYDSCPIIDALNDEELETLTDVALDIEGTIYQDIIEKFYTLEIVDGTQEGNFEPKRSITRAEFTKIVLISHCHVYDEEDPTWLSYSDLDTSSWQARVVSKAQKLGIINGYEDNSFRPNDVITKAEATKILMRMAYITVNNPKELGYNDIETVWQQKYARMGEALGVFNSEADTGIFLPNEGVLREDMVSLIYRVVDLYR